MFLNISVKDIELSNASTIYDNNVEILEKDIVSNLKLMKYLDSNKIYFFDVLELKSLSLHYQNAIGTLFLETAGLTIDYNNKTYLNYAQCRMLFSNLDIILGYLNIAYKKTQLYTDNTNIVDIEHFTTKTYNLLVLNYFALRYRNYASMEKHIPDTDILYDINLDYGEYSKEISLTRFMLTHFLRYIGLKNDQVPFSNGFGSNIKNLIQKKNNDLTKTILYEEIHEFLVSLSSMYNRSFSIRSLDIVETGYVAQKLTVNVFLQAEKEDVVKIILEA